MLNLTSLHPESLALLILVLEETQQRTKEAQADNVGELNDLHSIRAKIVEISERRAVVEASSEAAQVKTVLLASLDAESQHWEHCLEELEGSPDACNANIEIFVKFGDAAPEPIEINPNATLNALKTKVAHICRCPRFRNALSCNGGR